MVDTYSLLPRKFHDRVVGARARAFWCMALMLQVTVLVVLVSIQQTRDRARDQYDQWLESTVSPVRQLRDSVAAELEHSERIKRWHEQLKTACPDDSLLQTLASVTLSMPSDPDAVVLDDIRIRLPVESVPKTNSSVDSSVDPSVDPSVDGSQGVASVGRVEVSARCRGVDAVHRWLDALKREARLSNVEIESLESEGELARVRLVAVPLATRVLP